MNMVRMNIVVGLVMLGCHLAAQAQTTQPAEPPVEAPVELRSASPMRDTAAIRKTLDELKAEIAALSPGPSTRPTSSQPTTRPDADLASRVDGWRIELWQALGELESQLGELLRLTQSLESAASNEQVARLTQEITVWKDETQKLEETPTPPDVSDQQLAEATKRFGEHSRRLEELVATLAQQESLLKDGFKSQREKLKAEIDAAMATREALAASYEIDLKSAESEGQREIVAARRRVAAARVSYLEAARAAIDLRERATQKEHEHNRLRADSLRPLVAALRRHVGQLSEEKSRSVAERLRRQLDAPGQTEAQRAFIRLQLTFEDHVARLHQMVTSNILDRFSEAALADLSTALARDTQYWEQFAESLSRRSASDVLAAHAQANREEQAVQQLLRQLLTQIDQTISEQRAIEDMERAALEAFDIQVAAFRELTAGVTDEATIKLRQEVGQLRLELRNVHEELLTQEQVVLTRLRKALAVAQERAALCERAVSRLYWSHLFTRGLHYLDMRRYDPLAAEVQAVRQGLLGETIGRMRTSAFAQARTMQLGDWTVVVMALAANVLIAVWLYRRLYALRDLPFHSAPPLVEPADASSGIVPPQPPEAAEAEGLTFVQRLVPRLAQTLCSVIPAALPAAMLATLVVTMGLTGNVAQVAHAVAGAWLCLVAAWAVLEVAFRAAKTRYRVIPCSSVVARHYVRWGRVLIVLAVVLLVPGRLLTAAQILQTTAGLLGEWFKFAATVAFFCFIVQRESVLNVWPRAMRGRFAGTLMTMHTGFPAVVLAVLGMGISRVIGYTALADYLSISVLSSALLLLAATVVYQVFREVVIRVAARIERARQAYGPAAAQSAATPPAGGEPPAVEVSPTVPTAQLPSAIRFTLSTAKWILAVAAAVIALNIWGIRPYEIKRALDFGLWEHNGQYVTLWRIGGAVIAVLVAVVFSRGLRQTLQTRFYPNHPGIDLGAQAAINTLLHYMIIFIGIYVGLSTLRLDLGALAVLFGGLGLGIGLGLQSLVVNFISGLLILFERHIKVGDTVMVQDKQGEVVSINMRSTTLRTPDGLFMIIPNGEFITQKVENWTLRRAPIRGLLEIGVSYGADPKAVRQTLLEIAEGEARVLLDPPPEVHFRGFGDSSLNFALAAWYRTTGDRWYGMIEMRYAIMKRFADAEIQIPFPQRDLHIRSGVLDVRLQDGERSITPPAAGDPSPPEPPTSSDRSPNE